MTQRRITGMVTVLVSLMILANCQGRPSVPPASEFQQPAVGTPMPGGHEEALSPDFAPNTGGVLFINQTGFPVQVAVNNTIATIPREENFLFILPPGTHQFYLYQPDLAPRSYTETATDGKLRYVYLSKALPR